MASPPQYPRHIPSIPYTPSATTLQTLDLWLPRPLSESDPKNSLWIIYIHGGAWRDPTQTSQTLAPTIPHLIPHLSPHHHPACISALASLNYRLSPYPSHPSLPSDPSDPDRNATHPSHVRDVAAGLEFLRAEYGMRRWVGVGHSCGATLLLQYVGGIGGTRRGETEAEGEGEGVLGPEALVLLEGIYDVPRLLGNHAPPVCRREIYEIYRDFVRGAFGEEGDGGVYVRVSPTAGAYTEGVWPEGRLVVLGYSEEDELVEGEQRDLMVARLREEGWTEGAGRRTIDVKDVKGSHDWIWEDGRQIADLLREVVDRLLEESSH